MPLPLTRKQLDVAGCGTPNCDHDHSELYLVQACHPHRGVEAKYVKATGTLLITCQICDAPVAEVRVQE